MADTNIAAEYKAAIKQIADAERNGASDKELDNLCITAARKFFPESRERINNSLNDDIDAFLDGKPITRFESRLQERTETRPQEGTQFQPQHTSQNNRPQHQSQQRPLYNQPRPHNNEPRRTTQVPVARAEERPQPVVQQSPKFSRQIEAKEIIPAKQAAPTSKPLPSGKHINYIEKTVYDMIAKEPEKGYMSAVNIKPDRLAAFIAESKELGDTAVQQLFEMIQSRRENTK